MSRTALPAYRPVRYEIPDDLKTERLTHSATPNVKGLAGAARRICELWNYDPSAITTSFVKLHTERTKLLAYHKIGGNRYYSDRDLFDLMHIGTRLAAPEQTVTERKKTRSFP